MPGRARFTQKRWCMFSSEHSDLSNSLAYDGLHFAFHPHDTDVGAIKSFDTSIMGSFKCNNARCKKTGWSSKKIAITIRLYANDRYNARVYYQSCKQCDTLAKPEVDESYAERVMYRLKKWKGIDQAPAIFVEGSKGPHEKSLCEGCKAGHCKEGGDDGLAAAFGNMGI